MERTANNHTYLADFEGVEIFGFIVYNHSYSKDEPDSRINDVI